MAAKVFSKEGSALLLLLGAAAWFTSPHHAAAADLSHSSPLFHPLAADLNQLAENVRKTPPMQHSYFVVRNHLSFWAVSVQTALMVLLSMTDANFTTQVL